MTKFKVGDEVRIIKSADKRSNYKGLCNHTGIVKYIREYRDEITYYLQLSDRVNPAQEQGLFVFDEKDLEAKQLEFMLGIPMSHNLFRAGIIDEKGNLKENENMYRNSDVLDLYFDKENAKINKKYQEKERKIRKKDPVIGQIEAFKTQMKDVKGLKIDYEYDVPQEIREKLIVLRNDENNERDKLHELCREIRTMVQACETYEQHQAILKAYGIIDEQGKLVK